MYQVPLFCFVLFESSTFAVSDRWLLVSMRTVSLVTPKTSKTMSKGHNCMDSKNVLRSKYTLLDRMPMDIPKSQTSESRRSQSARLGSALQWVLTWRIPDVLFCRHTRYFKDKAWYVDLTVPVAATHNAYATHILGTELFSMLHGKVSNRRADRRAWGMSIEVVIQMCSR